MMEDSPYTKATKEGRIARRNGLPESANPYHPYFPSRAGAWRSGWESEGDFQMDTQWAARIVYGPRTNETETERE